MGLLWRRAAQGEAGPAASAEDAAAGGEQQQQKRKLTKKEKEKAEKELRKALPPLSQVGRNGLFEMVGQLSFTWAAGNVPGGPFVPCNVVAHGHNLYVFEGGQAGHRPSAKPRTFFQVKRAEVAVIGRLQIPPLPPHFNVFRIEFTKKQFGHRAFFFKAESTKEMTRWMTDLNWRVQASEAEIKRRFEPQRGREVVQRRLDETESAVHRQPERVVGLAVRYEQQEVAIADIEEEA